jgi:hypothetical protein
MSKVLKILKTITVGGRDLKCEACGNDFVCGVSLKGCWCADVKVSDETRTAMRAQFKECLCKDCLEKQERLNTRTEE